MLTSTPSLGDRTMALCIVVNLTDGSSVLYWGFIMTRQKSGPCISKLEKKTAHRGDSENLVDCEGLIGLIVAKNWDDRNCRN